MANIILSNKLSDVVLLKGKCYSFLQTTTSSVTNPLSDVLGTFSTCEECYNSEIRIETDQIVDVGTRTDDMNFVFVVLSDETATLIVNSVSFVLKNDDDRLVWDYGEAGEHTFTTVYETVSRTAGGSTFDVVLTGTEYLTFSLMNFS